MYSYKPILFRNKDNSLTLYFKINNELFSKKYTRDLSLPSTFITDKCENGFSVFSQNDNTYISTQNQRSEIFLYKESENGYEEKKLINWDINSYNLNHVSFMSKGVMNIVYTLNNGDKKYNLYLLSLKGEGESKLIDSTLPLIDTPFEYDINPLGLRLFYKTEEAPFVMSEIDLASLSIRTDTILSKSPLIIDFSTIFHIDCHHFVFLIKAKTGSRLIYRSLNKYGLSPIKTLWQGGSSSSCFVMILGGRLTVFWVVSNNLYCCFLEGEEFSKPYINKMEKGELIKAPYINSKPDLENLLSKVTLYNFPPYKMAIIDSYIKDFIPFSKIEPDIDSISDLKTQVDILKNHIEKYEEDITLANIKIEDLTKRLSARTNELNQVNAVWSKKYNSLYKSRNTSYGLKDRDSKEAQAPPQEE